MHVGNRSLGVCALPYSNHAQIEPNYHTMLQQVVVLVGAGAFVHLASSFLNCESEIQAAAMIFAGAINIALAIEAVAP